MSARYCDGCGGPIAGAGCPLCDPRPTDADRDAGCVCLGRDAPIAAWKPIAGCPVHNPPREVLLDVPAELEPVLAALYGSTWRELIAEHVAGQLEETSGPGAPPVDTDRGEDESPPVDAGGPGRDRLEARR